MPTFDILRETSPQKSFRVDAVRSMFDLADAVVRERFAGNLDIENRDWNVGVIYGASGSGKSTVARELFPDAYIAGFDYSAPSIMDDMPKDCDIKSIVKIFNSVGFSSPPSWLKPYSVLSNGEKMRVDLARSILENRDLICFDEFTSVINREVAKIGSFAIQKAIRKMGRRFVAVSCHDDILDWLEPDWEYRMDDGCFFLSGKGDGPKSRSRFTESITSTGKFLGDITI